MKSNYLALITMIITLGCGSSGNAKGNRGAPPPSNPLSNPNCTDYSGNYKASLYYVTILQDTCDLVAVRYYDSIDRKLVKSQLFTQQSYSYTVLTPGGSFERSDEVQLRDDELVISSKAVNHSGGPYFYNYATERLSRNPDSSISDELINQNPVTGRFDVTHSVWTRD